MNLKRIAASAAAFLLMFGVFAAKVNYHAAQETILTASADYEFEFVDEDDDTADIDDIDIDDIEVDDITVDTGVENNDHSYRDTTRSHNPVMAFIISLIIGLVVALIAVSIMKSSMKSVHKKSGAADYRKENSFKLTKNLDTFMYKRVDKTAIPKNNPPMQQNNNSRK